MNPAIPSESLPVKVLTAVEVTRVKTRWGHMSDVPSVVDLCGTVELLRADNDRLKGLIEGMGHEHSCGANYHVGSKRGPDPCNCVKSKVNA